MLTHHSTRHTSRRYSTQSIEPIVEAQHGINVAYTALGVAMDYAHTKEAVPVLQHCTAPDSLPSTQYRQGPVLQTMASASANQVLIGDHREITTMKSFAQLDNVKVRKGAPQHTRG